MSSILKDVSVSEVMSIKLFTISPDQSVEQARKLMHTKHFGGLPVVDNKRLVGIVTLKDVSNVEAGKREKTKIKDIMVKEVVTISPKEKVSTALEKMSKLRVMRLPVVSGVDTLIGVITLTDIEKTSRTLKSKKLSHSKPHKCKACGAALNIAVSNTVKCDYCGTINPLWA
ncbi:MAG: CBS domain-containing protein [Thaumarchaeota archaeon]|nr:CBS domain-containing protein [Nitrososphaerota archaeon]